MTPQSSSLGTHKSGARTPHPEDFCHRCGRPNVVWFAPSEIWNKAAPDDGILCPVCFVQSAEAAGISTAWEVRPESFEVENISEALNVIDQLRAQVEAEAAGYQQAQEQIAEMERQSHNAECDRKTLTIALEAGWEIRRELETRIATVEGALWDFLREAPQPGDYALLLLSLKAQGLNETELGWVTAYTKAWNAAAALAPVRVRTKPPE